MESITSTGVESDIGDDVMERVTSTNCLKRDRGDYYEFVPNGVMLNQNGYLWVAGREFVDECKLKDDGPLYSVPSLVLQFPKKLPANMTFESLMNQVIDEAVDKFSASVREVMKKARITSGEKKTQGLGDNSNSMVRDQTADAEAGNMDHEPLTNNLAMKQLNSALDNCAKGNCAACGGAGSSDELKADNLVK